MKVSSKNFESHFMSKGEKIFMSLNTVLLFLVLVITLFPLLYVFSASFSSADAVMGGRVFLFPVEPTLDAYKEIFKYKDILTGYSNSIFYTVVGTLVNVVLTIMAAYPLYRKDFKSRNVLMFVFTFTMLFSGGLIPTYLIVNSLHLINTPWAMILPSAISAYNVIVTRTYFQSTISVELLEAAQLDGCNDIKFLLKIVLPLSGAIIAVISLFYAIGHWNSYFDAMIYLHDRKLYPLQIVLREILLLNTVQQNSTSMDAALLSQKQRLMELLKYSLIVASSLPTLCIYPFVQRFFVKGVMIGAIKG